MSRWRGRRWAVWTSVAGTVAIALGAFWLSFTSLADLARRSGIGERQAWAWPLIVDGVIVVSTVAVVALSGERTAWYPWTLLGGGAAVSVTANSLHAVVAADADVPGPLAAAVAAVPPVVLLAITHLTVVLARTTATEAAEPVLVRQGVDLSPSADMPAMVSASGPDVEPDSASSQSPENHAEVWPAEAAVGRRVRAAELREVGWSNKQIARELRVHPSTVGRWFAGAHQVDEPGAQSPEPVLEGVTP